jgi:N,N'-diacetylchitobiose transport system permease protein
MAASVLFSLPVVIFFLLIQRKLVAGMSAGAVKG